MVSSYDDAGQVAWAKGVGIDIIRGSGRLDGPGRVTVDGAAYTAGNIVPADGAETFIPPVPAFHPCPASPSCPGCGPATRRPA